MSGLNDSSMKVSDVERYLKRTFGDESQVQLTDEDIYRWINAAQREILVTNKILKKLASTNLVAGTSEYQFPSLDILEVQAIHVDGTKMQFYSFQEAEDYIIENDPQRSATGSPSLWYEWAGVFYLYPTPSSDITDGIKIYYVDAPSKVSSLTDELSVPDSFFNRVVEYCLGQAYEMDENTSDSQYKMAQFAQGLDTMANQEVMTHADSYPRITVLPEDDW